MAPFNIERILTDPSVVKELVDQKDQLFTLPTEEGAVQMKGLWFLVNLIMCRPLIRRGMIIGKRHIFYEEEFTKAVQKRIHTNVLNDIMTAERSGIRPVLSYETPDTPLSDLLVADIHPKMLKQLDIMAMDPAKVQLVSQMKLRMELAGCINILYNVICIYLGAYQRSIDMFSICKSMAVPEIATAAKVDLEDEVNKRNINAAEKKIADKTKTLLATLSDPKLKDQNVFYPYVRLGVASPQQVPQVVMAAGTRTDVNDMMILSPITSSYIGGLKDIYEFAIDSLSAKKSLLYNASGLGDSQYANRKEQLMASTLWKIYPGDCGSDVTLDFEILPINHKHCVGKFISEKGKLVELTYSNLQNYLGKVVKLRSPITCRHTDGCCHACGGRMLDFLMPNTVIGIASTIELMSPVGQLILSNKHVSRTTSMTYVLPHLMDDYLQVSRNEVHLHVKAKKLAKKWMIAVPFHNVARISDLQYVEDEDAINDQHFSQITEISFVDGSTGEFLTPIANMIDVNKSIPYLSSEILGYIKRNPDMIKDLGDTLMISMEKFDVNKPLMRCIVANASMPRFSKQIRTLFSDDIKKYTSAVDVLRDFTNIVYSKVDPHLFHLEVIVRASMVTSGQDYRIPVVTDPRDVKFGALRYNIRQRSIGAQLAFERMKEYIEDPRTYTYPREMGPFDAFAGLF